MADTLDDKLKSVQDTVVGGLTKSLTLAGVSGVPLLVGGFVAEAVFRVVRLCARIREKQHELEKKMEEAVRDRDIVRQPIYEDIDQAAAWVFFQPAGAAARDFPEIYEQLRPEIEEVVNKPLNARPEARRALLFAYRFLTRVYEQNRFVENPVLDELFGAWIDPGAPQYGHIAREAARLFPDDGMLTPGHLMEAAEDYFLSKLKSEIGELHEIEENAQKEMAKAFKELILGALVGDEGAVARTLKFAKDVRLEKLGEQIDKLKEELKTADKSRKDWIEQRIKELESLQERIKGL